MLNIYKTNRIELISDLLAKELLINPPPLTENLSISIQNFSLGIWMRDQITLSNEISALYEFKTLTTFTEEIIKSIYQENNFKRWNHESIKWSIIESLEELGEYKESWPLKYWIKKIIQNKKVLNTEIYSLSGKIAKVFSDYILYRPEIIEKWHKTNLRSSNLYIGLNEDQYWQPILFKLIEKNKLNKPSCLYINEFINNNIPNKIIVNSLPKDLYIVATNNISKLQIRFYCKLSEITNVNIYLLSPGYDLWNRINIQEGPIALNKNLLEKNILKENIEHIFGKYISEFEKMIEETIYNEEVKVNIQTPYIDPTYNLEKNKNLSLLNQVQRELVSDTKIEKYKIIDNDESFIFRECSNRLTELIYIRNKILKICSTNKNINYSDILITTNQLDQLKPYLKYIFNSETKIPYFLSIENYKDISPIYNFLQKLLGVANKKFTSDGIKILLSDPLIQSTYDFNNKEKDEILSLLIDSGFHWGINSQERLGEIKNSLEWCIKRFTLGLIYGNDYYIKEEDIKPFSIYDSSIDLNKWIIILSQIKNIINKLRGSYSFDNWINNLRNIFHDINVQNDIFNEDINKLKQTLNDISKSISSDTIIDLNVLIEILNTNINIQNSNLNARRNEVLVSDIESSRYIPHKITFLMGMNHNSFPRKVYKDNMNLLSNKYLFGDPNLMDKERYIFLELLTSCREHFIVLWSKYDMENNMLEISSPIKQLINLLNNKVDKNNKDKLIKKINFDSSQSEEIRENLVIPKQGLINSLIFNKEKSKYKEYRLLELINWFQSPQLYWLKKRNIIPKKTFNFNPSDEKISNYQKYKVLSSLSINSNIDDNNFKEKLSGIDIRQHLILNGIISPKNSIYINELEINNLIQSLISILNNFTNIERKYLREDSNKIEFFRCENQIIELIHTDINFTKRSEIWLKLLFIARFDTGIDKVQIIYRKNNIYKTEILNAPNRIESSKILYEYTNIYFNSIDDCLPLPPESSYKYTNAFMKNKDFEKAFIDEWIGNKKFHFGERDKKEMIICYGNEREPYFFIKNKNFHELSLKLFKPLLDAF